MVEDTLMLMALPVNKANDEEPSATCSDNKENLDETSVFKDSYTLEHKPDNAEYTVPYSENTKFWQSAWRVLSQNQTWSEWSQLSFSVRLPMIENKINLDIFPPEIMWGCGMRETLYTMKNRKCYQFHNATNSLKSCRYWALSNGDQVLAVQGQDAKAK